MNKNEVNVLHLERKFTAVTETFIVDQINTTIQFEPYVFSIKNLNNLHSRAKVFNPETNNIAFLDLHILSRKSSDFFKEKFKNVEPKIIHAHFLTDARFFHPFTKAYKIPKICSCYGYDVSRFPKRFGGLAKYYLQKAFDEYDLFLAMSDDMKSDLLRLGCPENKIKIHYYGVDTKKFSIPRDYTIKHTFNILTIGSLVPKKGHISVLKALAKIRKEMPDLSFKYNIVGSGYLKSELERFINENSLNDFVCFKGLIKHGKDFNEIMEDSHVFVHPSITTKEGDKEGIPGTIVEAMASGLPVIATYHAGIPYVIKNGFNGFLVNEHDHDLISDVIIKLFNDQVLRKTIGENAKDHASVNLDLYLNSVKLEGIYSSLIY